MDKIVGYVAVEANNIGNDIYISDIYKTKEKAKEILKNSYEKLIAEVCAEEIEIDCQSYKEESYSILLETNDYYYGVIKKVKIYDEIAEEEQQMTAKGYVKKNLGMKQYWYDGDRCIKEAKKRYE